MAKIKPETVPNKRVNFLFPPYQLDELDDLYKEWRLDSRSELLRDMTDYFIENIKNGKIKKSDVVKDPE